jgi:hypothetical protein
MKASRRFRLVVLAVVLALLARVTDAVQLMGLAPYTRPFEEAAELSAAILLLVAAVPG